jgi:bifunctional UDP-N-acetylglucosamine pyrophosphorylase/glucosamine-1-phosphate N-acetyltransferase
MKKSVVHAIVPAAGKGRRMEAAFPGVPKVLVPLQGQPMLRWVVKSLSEVHYISGIRVIVSPDGAGDVKRSLHDLDVSYAVQDRPLGTGDAVRSGLECLPKEVTDVLIVYGDQALIRSHTISEVIHHHMEQKAVLTFLTVEMDRAPFGLQPLLRDWGRIVRDKQSRPLKIVEVRDATSAERAISEVNPSVWCVDALWLSCELTKLEPRNAQGEYYLTDVVESAAKQKMTVSTVRVSDARETLGANDPEQLRLLEEIAKERTVQELSRE